MDKVTLYKQIARKVVTHIASLSLPEENGVEYQLITDEEHGYYLYFGVGWEFDRDWVYATYAHISVKPQGAVWLHHDGTDLRIYDMLVREGIDKKDITIGFHSPVQRTWYAEA